MGDLPDFELLKNLDALLEEIDDICYIDFDRALTLAQKAQITAHQINAPEQLARALNYEAWVLVNNRQFEQAVEKALSALEYAHRYQLTEVECRAIGIIAASFVFVRDFANGCQLLEYQRDLAARTGDNNLASQALQDLGVVYLETSAPEDGIRLLKQAMAMVQPAR